LVDVVSCREDAAFSNQRFVKASATFNIFGFFSAWTGEAFRSSIPRQSRSSLCSVVFGGDIEPITSGNAVAGEYVAKRALPAKAAKISRRAINWAKPYDFYSYPMEGKKKFQKF